MRPVSPRYQILLALVCLMLAAGLCNGGGGGDKALERCIDACDVFTDPELWCDCVDACYELYAKPEP